MPFRGSSNHETVQAWRADAEAELTRLRTLTDAQLGAEVLRAGFGGLAADGERTRIGLSNSLCPEPPPAVGGDDIDVVEQYNGLLVPVLGALEDAGLLAGEPRGRSGLRFYSLTTRGRSALEADDVEAELTARSAQRPHWTNAEGQQSVDHDARDSATLADLAEEEFVSLTTYRRSGAAVSVPVWIAPATDGSGALLVTTTVRSGKVKRLRYDPRVQLQRCDRHGAVPADAPVVLATADIVDGAGDVRRLREAIRAKYGARMKTTAADQGISDPAEPARVILRIHSPHT